MNMEPLQKLLLDDMKKFSVGEISPQEMGKKMKYYEEQLGKEKYEEIVNPKGEETFDLIGLFTATQELDELALKELPGLHEKIKLKDEGFVGKFLIARLKLEHLVTKLIYEGCDQNLSITENGIAELSFFERLKQLPTEGRLYRNYVPALFSLNKFRNELVHNPGFDIDGFNPGALLFYMGKQIGGEQRQEVILSIMENATKYMLLETKAMQSKKNEILARYHEIKHLLIN